MTAPTTCPAGWAARDKAGQAGPDAPSAARRPTPPASLPEGPQWPPRHLRVPHRRVPYIALEGIKGCGKSSVLALILRHLDARGLPYACLRPCAPMPAWHPAEWLYKRLGLDGNDRAAQHLYALRSNWHAAQLDRGAPLVLGDRSILTSYAVRWPARGIPAGIAHLARVDALEWRIRRPDHVLFLDASVDAAHARCSARTARNYGRHHERPQQLGAHRAAYLELCAHAATLGLDALRWHRIDADRPLDDVAAQASSVIDTLLDKGN